MHAQVSWQARGLVDWLTQPLGQSGCLRGLSDLYCLLFHFRERFESVVWQQMVDLYDRKFRGHHNYVGHFDTVSDYRGGLNLVEHWYILKLILHTCLKTFQ